MESNTNNTVVENKEVIQQQNTSDVPVTQAQPSTQDETPEQINWKKFREARERDRKEREAAEKKAKEKEAEAQALKAAMDAILNKKPTNSAESSRDQYSEEEEETEDQKIQKKVESALLAREQQLEAQRKQKEQADLPKVLASTYRDFNEVCSEENLDYLEYHYPEVASAFKYAPDGFEKWSSVYKAVKRFVPNTDSKKDQKKADKNFNKPQSMAVSGVTQTGDSAPMQLDDKRRSDNWARMQRVMKGGR